MTEWLTEGLRNLCPVGIPKTVYKLDANTEHLVVTPKEKEY